MVRAAPQRGRTEAQRGGGAAVARRWRGGGACSGGT